MAVNFNYTKNNSGGESECLQVGAENVQELADILRLAGMDHSPEKMQSIMIAHQPNDSQEDFMSSLDNVVIKHDDEELDPQQKAIMASLTHNLRKRLSLLNEIHNDYPSNRDDDEDEDEENWQKMLSDDPGYAEWSDKLDKEQSTPKEINKMYKYYLKREREKERERKAQKFQ